MLLDIRPDYLQMVQTILHKHVPQYAVWAFGSRAKWTAKEYSDLDLCIVSDQPLSFTLLGMMAEDFSDSDLPWKVDIVDWATTSKEFREIIARDKVVVQEGRGMRSEWTLQKISALGEFDRGKSKHRPRDAKHLYGGPYPFIQTGDVTNSGGRITTFRQTYSEAGLAQSRLWPAGTLAITIAANIAETALLTFPACFPDSVVGFTAHPQKADIRFVEYLFQAMRKQVKSHAYGSAQENINLDVLRRLEFPIPVLDMQVRIADFLSLLDDRITLLHETNATLEAIAQAMFKSWFVDFDPVHAKANPPSPPLTKGGGEAGGFLLPPEIAALFPDSFEESELGLVPRGWKVGKVADIGEVICGKTPPTSEAANYGDDVPFITIPDMHNLLVITSTNRSLSTLGANTQKKKTLPPGSICVSCIATAGLVARVTVQSQTNQQINSVVPLAKWGKSFPLFTLRRIGDAVRAGGSGGSIFHNLNKSGFEQLKVLFPNELLALAFSEVAEPIIEKITVNQLQAQNLATLRDTLLPRLISGQLRLPELVNA